MATAGLSTKLGVSEPDLFLICVAPFVFVLIFYLAVPHAYPDDKSAVYPQPITWSTGTGKWKGQWGRREMLRCPPAVDALEPIWGTDFYTDDSSICTAAVHAGLITAQEGGTVTIEVLPDHFPYHGTARNGISSRHWMDHWPGSFTFVRGAALSGPAPAVRATGSLQADSWIGQIGREVTLLCPAQFELHTVYGTDVYTADSYICSAAVHAGIIVQRSGGMVTIKLKDGQASYAGSTRNGITSFTNDSHPGSFSFVATPPGTPPPPAASTPTE
jgi:hypothetical protein